MLKDIPYSFITDFEHFLKGTRKCNHNSSQKYIRNFRKIINKAMKNDWLDKDPFSAYRVKLKDTKRVFLTKEELAALEEIQLQVKSTRTGKGCIYFLLLHRPILRRCRKLTAKHIVKSHDGEFWINIDRAKTGSASNIPMLSKAMKVIDKYKYQTHILM